jgi:hypothetical protein
MFCDGLFISYRASRLQKGLNLKMMEVVGVSGVLQHPAFAVFQMKDLGLVFSVTTKGPVYLGSNFPEASVRGLHGSIESPVSMFFSLTFLSLHVLVSFW